MPSTIKTYVAFVFSPAFINQNKGKAPETLESVQLLYKEREVEDCDLSTLQVPKGTLYFWFYNRLVTFAHWKTHQENSYEKLQSRPLNESGRYFLENEGDFYQRVGLEGDQYDHQLAPSWRKELLDLMNKNNSNSILQVVIDGGWDVRENFILGQNDVLISPDKVQMFDTAIPWRKK